MKTFLTCSCLAALAWLLIPTEPRAADAEPPQKWLPATAHVVPKQTATEGEGYFSIIEGLNGRLYIGTHANAVNSWLVEFDPETKEDGGRRRCPQGDRHGHQGLRLAGEDPHAQQHRRQRQDLLRHQAGLSQQGRETRGLPGRLPDGLRSRRPARRRSTPSRCRTRASTASRPTRSAASPTSRPVPITAPGPARIRTLPGPRSEDREVSRS